MDKNRYLQVVILIIIIAVIFIIALFKIQILDYKFYKKKAENQQRRFIKIATDRGDIFDCRGEILATSLNSYSIYINPRVFNDYQRLSQILGEKVENSGRKKYFVWVKRKIDSVTAEKVRKSDLEGLGIVVEKKRVYPHKKLASQVIGFTGIDNEGMAGIERSLDSSLRAKEGWIKTYADPVGYELLQAKREKIDPAEQGLNVVLNLDHRIQHAAERELEAALKKFGAISGTAIVMDVKTGEILALASKPDFDPNSYAKYDKKRWNSRACLVYEPGSTFKVITVAAALEEKAADVDTKLKAMEQIVVGGKTISNAHEIKWPGSLTSVSFMLEQSVNTGAVQLAKKLGKEKFYKIIKKFGFGERTNFGLPGESAGILNHYKNWYKPDIAMISFGQSIAVTPVQLLRAVSSIANEGKVIQPRLIKRIESQDGSYVKTFSPKSYGRSISKETAEKVMEMMENVIVKGTGKSVRMKYFSVAGKTGTAQKVQNRRYLKGHYIASFIGFAPTRDPRVSALVIIDDPRGKIWGASTAGPVFKRVVEETLRILNIKPDQI